VVLLAIAWFLVTRWLAVFSEAINWDEFALLARADRTLRLGEVHGDGRPGLVTVMLIPFVKGCVDSVQAAVNARILWQFVTLAYLAGVYALVHRWISYARDPHGARFEGPMAVALLAFLPAFVTWSIQVRTDQAALAAAVWGGVLLMSPKPRHAVLGGLLFGAGVLCTQKALYVIGLCGVLFATGSVSRVLSASGGARRETIEVATRAALAAAAGSAAIVIYIAFVPTAAKLASQEVLASSFDTMNQYRRSLGYRAYTVNASRLWVHWLLLAFLVFWTIRAVTARNRTDVLRLATCWIVLLLGIAVVRVHGSNFPYFLMTAGLFPAVALGLAAGPALELAGNRKLVAAVGLVAVLLWKSTPESFEMLSGYQDRQRETLRLVNSSELRAMRGYQVEGGLVCAADPDPMPTMFTAQIMQRARRGPSAFDGFVAQFRDRPIAYIVESYRMGAFPPDVKQFWKDHYVPYAAALHVAGFRIASGGAASNMDVIVAGRYRWIPSPEHAPSVVKVAETVLRPHETIWLGIGVHPVATLDPEVTGSLVLAISAPVTGETFPFYDPRQASQLRGYWYRHPKPREPAGAPRRQELGFRQPAEFVAKSCQ
jgi:hypothetical protein